MQNGDVLSYIEENCRKMLQMVSVSMSFINIVDLSYINRYIFFRLVLAIERNSRAKHSWTKFYCFGSDIITFVLDSFPLYILYGWNENETVISWL